MGDRPRVGCVGRFGHQWPKVGFAKPDKPTRTGASRRGRRQGIITELRIGCHAPLFPVDGSDGHTFLSQLTTMMTAVESRFDSVWFDDHLRPWADFVPPDTDNLECLTTISYLAPSYPEFYFGCSVLCQSFRNPSLVAKMAANLQFLTGGRFILGLGAGWMEPEYSAYGYPFPDAPVRISQLREAVQVVRALWSDVPATFEGRYYRVSEAICRPLPDPVPPILIGGGGERLTLRVVAEHADWWNFTGMPETYAHKLDVLREHCRAVGRDYDEIVKTYSAEFVAIAETEQAARRIAAESPYTDVYPIVGDPEQVAAALRPLVEHGVSHLILRFVDFPSPAGAELFADAVTPLLH